MTQRTIVLVTLSTVFGFLGVSPLAHAQLPIKSTITFDVASPSSPGPAKISGTGSYTIEKGYSNPAILLIATLKSDPKVQKVIVCQNEDVNKTWNGLLVVPPGTCLVKGRMTVSQPPLYSNPYNVETAEKELIVTVP